MNRETLRTLGLTEEQIDAVMADHGRGIQAVQTRLTTAENRVSELETELDDNKNSDEVKTLTERAETSEAKVNELQGTIDQTTKTSLIDQALTDAGAKDLDYAKFKLGDVELQEDGTIKDLDNLVKDLREQLPNQFEVAETDESNAEAETKDPLDGFTRINPAAGAGKDSEPDVTQDMIAAFTADLQTQ